MLNSKIGMVNR